MVEVSQVEGVTKEFERVGESCRTLKGQVRGQGSPMMKSAVFAEQFDDCEAERGLVWHGPASRI